MFICGPSLIGGEIANCNLSAIRASDEYGLARLIILRLLDSEVHNTRDGECCSI
jgi:hypothetical protein